MAHQYNAYLPVISTWLLRVWAYLTSTCSVSILKTMVFWLWIWTSKYIPPIYIKQKIIYIFLSPDVSTKGTILMCVVHAFVPNWFTDDNLRMKSRIEAWCDLYVYPMNIYVKFDNNDFSTILTRVIALCCTSSLLNFWFLDDNLWT